MCLWQATPITICWMSLPRLLPPQKHMSLGPQCPPLVSKHLLNLGIEWFSFPRTWGHWCCIFFQKRSANSWETTCKQEPKGKGKVIILKSKELIGKIYSILEWWADPGWLPRIPTFESSYDPLPWCGWNLSPGSKQQSTIKDVLSVTVALSMTLLCWQICSRDPPCWADEVRRHGEKPHGREQRVASSSHLVRRSSVLQPQGNKFCQQPKWVWHQIFPSCLQVRT